MVWLNYRRLLITQNKDGSKRGVILIKLGRNLHYL